MARRPLPAVRPTFVLLLTVAATAALAAGQAAVPAAAPTAAPAEAPPAVALAVIELPPPETSGGLPLLSAIAARRSARSFAPDPLPLPVLSTLLWAAWGVSREDGRRTAPTARNRQATDVYVVLPEGAYLYDAHANALRPVAAGDLRALTGRQDFVGEAPLNLVYVERMPDGADESALVWAGSHAGFIGENVYLYCASAGLATVVRGLVDRDALASALRLPEGHRVLLAQTVGYPRR